MLVGVAMVAAGGCLWPATAQGADGLTQALTTLKQAGSANDNAAATAKAWSLVAGADAAQLPDVLAALEGAGPVAANWIRSAIDAIAERQAQAGKKLPLQQLESFVLDSKRPPRARRAAYELLCLSDAAAPERLLPNMLQDASVELRRDAVARVIEHAKAKLDAKENEAAQKELQLALAGAVDLDQVTQIEQRLKDLGQKVDVPRHFGYLMQWKLIGPFDNVEGKGFNVAYPPEAEQKFEEKLAGKEGEVAWIEHQTDDRLGLVDLNKALGKNMGAAGYALAAFHSPQARPIELRMNCVCANKVWLNGRLVASNEVYHSGEEFDQYVAAGRLQAGKNTILVKVCQNEMKEPWAQDWRFSVRVCDETGTAVLSADRPIAEAPPQVKPASGG